MEEESDTALSASFCACSAFCWAVAAVGRGLLRVRVGPAGLLLRITDGGICVIGLLLRVRGLLVGRINIGLGLVGVLLMGGGFGGGLILRGLCGPLVGFCLRLVIGGLPHGLAGVIDGVGRVVRGLLAAAILSAVPVASCAACCWALLASS